MNQPEVMTIKDLAEYLQVHQQTIYRQIKKGAIPYFRMGSDYRFLKVQIDRWTEEKTVHPC